MKKTLLAAALLAGFAGVAQAETSVTLYGIIDTGIGYNKIKGSVNGVSYNHSRISEVNGVKNGSRWGLRGSEDLGDGLSAVFNLESGFNSSNGNSAQGGRLFGRQATVGLASDNWGRLEFGRQTNLSSKYFGSIDPFGAGFGQANIGVGFSAANTYRLDNLVLYQTPSFGGFRFGVGYSFNADSNNTDQSGFATADNTRAITVGGQYVNGPLNVALSFDQLNGANNSSVDNDAKPRQYAIGAAYDFEVLKLSLGYARTTDGWFGGQDAEGSSEFVSAADRFGTNRFADGFKANSYLLGVSVPFGSASNIFGSWQRVDPSNTRLTGGDSTMNVFSLGYTYDLSKRTNVYVYGSYGKNYAFHDDLKSTAAAVGLQHRF
ncbi:porin [Achromobacter pulmonis]|uniref:Porin n=1 Tax=Achromobacter pulmonis TaxID=1389932 RepID=A0A2N8K8P0_9BURK|nr:porin [Achromobacter pulmonis]PND29822.1 porin [Achromobacter pulmonis]